MSNLIYSDEFFDAYNEIIIECWSDEEFKKRFLADPIAVLKEWEIDLGEIKNVKVVETGDIEEIALGLPVKSEGFDEYCEELSDEDLDGVAGGILGIRDRDDDRNPPRKPKMPKIPKIKFCK